MNAGYFWEQLQASVRIFRRNARLYLLNSILGGLSYSIFSLFFNLYILAYGYPKDFLGFLTALPAITALVAAVPMGMLSDRLGRRAAMLWGTLAGGIAVVVIVAGASPLILVLAVILQGVGSELYNVSSAPFMMENSSDHERMALFSTSIGLGSLAGFIGSLAGGQLPRFLSGALALTPDTAPAYGAALLASPALNALAMLPLLWMHEPQVARRGALPNIRLIALAAEDGWRRARALPVLAWRALRHRPLIVKLLLPNAVISFGAALLIPYANVFFRERHHVPDGTLGLIFALSSVVTGLATLAAPVLARRWGKVRSVALTEAASLPFLLAIGFSPWLVVSAGGFLVRGALMNMGWPIYSAFMMEQVAEGERATVNAWNSVSSNLGWAICPYLSGLVQARWGFSPLFIVTASLYAVAAALTYWFFAVQQPAASQPVTVGAE